MRTPPLTLTLLGTFGAAVDDVPVTGFATDKVRALVAYLAVEADRAHLRAHLAALLWPDMAEAIALRNLRKTLHRLEQALSPYLGVDRVLRATRQAVQLQPAACTTDVAAFYALQESSAAHPHRALHLCPPCLARLAQAAALYRGELLAGFGLLDAQPFEEWLLLRREALLHHALKICYELAAAHLEREEYDQAYRYATRQVELDPGREEAHRQVLRALSRSGQHSETLAYFERCRQLLLDTLGVEPAEETVALVEQRGAPPRNRRGAAPGGARQVEPSRLRNLPVQLTPFVGRTTELLQIAEYLRDDECRVVSILGPGGVGKTRLAVRAAEQAARSRRFADGIVFVSLAEVDAVDLLPAVLATGLGLDLHQAADARARLLSYLAPRECLLVLDNLEQLLAGVDVVVAILSAAPGVRVLATSRLPLDLQAEQRVTLEGLDYPRPDGAAATGPASAAIAASSSAQLFVQAARRIGSEFALAPSNERDVLRLCQLVDGMPLALELAAPWVRVMDCAAIVSSLEQSLALLTTTARDVPVRHRSMSAVLSQSWRLLAPGEQTALGRLSVFRGPFDLDAAVRVVGLTVLDLAAFVDTGLLQRSEAGLYQLHPLLRQFAAERLAAMPATESAAVHDRQSRHFLGLVAGEETALYGPAPRVAVDTLQRQLANIRQAWEWASSRASHDTLAASLAGFGRFWKLTALFDDADGMLYAAADRLHALLGPNVSPASPVRRLLIRVLVWHAHIHEIRHRVDDAVDAAEAALALAEHMDDREGEAMARCVLGETLPHRGNFAPARRYLQQACSFFQRPDRRRSLAHALGSLGTVHWRAGEYRQAIEQLDRARVMQQSLGDHWELARVCSALAGVRFEQGDLDEARVSAHDALRFYEAMGDRRRSAEIRGNLALVYRRLGQFDHALRHNRADLETSQELGDSHGAAVALGNRGTIHLERGDLAQALQCFEQALQIEEDAGDLWDAARHRASVAQVCRLRGERERALAHYARALPVLRTHGADYYAVTPLLDAAELHLDLGRPADATALAHEAAKLAGELRVAELLERSESLAAKLAATERAARGSVLARGLAARTRQSYVTSASDSPRRR